MSKIASSPTSGKHIASVVKIIIVLAVIVALAIAAVVFDLEQDFALRWLGFPALATSGR